MSTTLDCTEERALQAAWIHRARYPEMPVRMEHWREMCGCTLSELIDIYQRLDAKGLIRFPTDYRPGNRHYR